MQIKCNSISIFEIRVCVETDDESHYHVNIMFITVSKVNIESFILMIKV